MAVDLTIIGQGKMGQALANHFEKAGMSVQVLGREQETVQGTFVVFAVPYEDMVSLIYPHQDYLAHKIIIDISNPLDYQTKASLLAPDQSASLKLATLFPNLTFIKAFNTNFSSSRIPASSSPIVLMSGDHLAAKEAFGQLLEKANFQPLDVGQLDKSRDLEAYARIQLSLLEAEKTEALLPFSL